MHSPLDHLCAEQPDLVADLERISSQLREPRNAGGSQRLVQEQASGRYALAIEYENLLKRVRELPGFERFLLPKKFHELTRSCTRGPVVMLNAQKWSRSDALILYG